MSTRRKNRIAFLIFVLVCQSFLSGIVPERDFLIRSTISKWIFDIDDVVLPIVVDNVINTPRTQNATGCYRPCPHYNNLIVFDPERLAGTNGRGLNDRGYVMAQTANLAAYLCAKIVWPSPHRMLSPLHNHGQRVSKDLTWKDHFFSYNLLATNETAVIEELQENGTEALPQPHRVYVSKRNKQVIRHFHEIRKSLRSPNDNDIPFLWKIQRSYWEAYDQLVFPEMMMTLSNASNTTTESDEITMLPIRCQAVYRQPSALVQQTAASVIQSLDDPQDFGYIHLRRGDTTHVCNTTVEKVREYIGCSLNGQRLDHNMTLVLSTEDESPSYLEGIKSVIESFGFQFVHLDALVKRHLEVSSPRELWNNHLTFAVVNQVAEHASFRLERRRHISCNDCDPDVIQEYMDKTL